MSNWIVHPTGYGATVMPLNDAIGHEDDSECPCGPTWKPITQLGGGHNWMLVHHSLDGREQQEEA